MSKVLMIRHLPATLTLQEKEQLLKHFGAEKVWETRTKHNYLFASFPTIDQAKSSLIRLHQLKIAQRRLVVEYSQENEPFCVEKSLNDTGSLVTKHIKEFVRNLNSLNPSVDFYQPPPSHLKYKYPEPTPKSLINIIHSISSYKPLYTQILHLMNKMNLDSPFKDNETAIQRFKNIFREFFLDEISLIPPPESETESELSSDETSEMKEKQLISTVVKRKHILPKTRKRPVALLPPATIPKVKKKKVVQQDIFEKVTITEPKKISVVVSQDILEKQVPLEPEVTGEMGKFQKEHKPADDAELTIEPEVPTISKKELLQNRISHNDMKILPVYKNYHPGPPSMRLYIKNLAKSVTELDVKSIYRRYVENLSENDQTGFDVRVMQEGRMKGQGFVTFPSVNLAEVALNETNGYILKDKPMVVQFARAANKKSIK